MKSIDESMVLRERQIIQLKIDYNNKLIEEESVGDNNTCKIEKYKKNITFYEEQMGSM